MAQITADAARRRVIPCINFAPLKRRIVVVGGVVGRAPIWALRLI